MVMIAFPIPHGIYFGSSKYNVDSLKQAIAITGMRKVVAFHRWIEQDAHQDCEGEDRPDF